MFSDRRSLFVSFSLWVFWTESWPEVASKKAFRANISNLSCHGKTRRSGIQPLEMKWSSAYWCPYFHFDFLFVPAPSAKAPNCPTLLADHFLTLLLKLIAKSDKRASFTRSTTRRFTLNHIYSIGESSPDLLAAIVKTLPCLLSCGSHCDCFHPDAASCSTWLCCSQVIVTRVQLQKFQMEITERLFFLFLTLYKHCVSSF